MYKIEEKNGKYVVVPTAETVMNNFNRFEMPYDSNWEIYKLFNFPPEDFIKYIISVFEAHVTIHYEFPWIRFYFNNYIAAEKFKNELETRALNP